MLRSVLLKGLRDASRGFAWWSLGLVGLVALMVSAYPSVRDNPSLNKLVEDYPQALKAFIAFGGQVDYTSAPGYLGSELFAFMVPLLLLIAAIGAAASAIAGEEERGTLELLLANPISRRRLVLEKAAAVTAEVLGLGLVLLLSLWIGARSVGMHISFAHLTAATVSAVLLAIVYGSVALLVGAATGRRALAIGITAAAAVAAYLVNGLAPLVEALEVPRKLSPFYQYTASDPLRQGLDASRGLVLLAITAAATLIAQAAFARRDLST